MLFESINFCSCLYTLYTIWPLLAETHLQTTEDHLENKLGVNQPYIVQNAKTALKKMFISVMKRFLMKKRVNATRCEKCRERGGKWTPDLCLEQRKCQTHMSEAWRNAVWSLYSTVPWRSMVDSLRPTLRSQGAALLKMQPVGRVDLYYINVRIFLTMSMFFLASLIR